MKKPNKTFLRILGAAFYWGPVLLAAYATQPYGAGLAVCLLALCWPMEHAGQRKAGLAPFSLVLLGDIAQRHPGAQGLVAALLFLALAGEWLLLYAQRERDAEIRAMLTRLRPPHALYPALTLAAAVVMTLAQGSGYFAVGAHGAGAPALLKSYAQLGFHPNWRTVLFSTVMLVFCIAWPRKFRKLSRVLPAGFVGLLAVTALNILQSPRAGAATVQELSQLPVPVLNRVPVSALSTLLLYMAWEEVPWRALKRCFTEKQAQRIPLLCAAAAALLCFDMLWVTAILCAVWDGLCVLNVVFFAKKADKEII